MSPWWRYNPNSMDLCHSVCILSFTPGHFVWSSIGLSQFTPCYLVFHSVGWSLLRQPPNLAIITHPNPTPDLWPWYLSPWGLSQLASQTFIPSGPSSLHVLTHRGRDKMARYFPDDIFKCIFLNENDWISITISLKLVPEGMINNNIPSVIQIMAWRRSGDKPLSEPMMVSLLAHIWVTWPSWVEPLMLRLRAWTITRTRSMPWLLMPWFLALPGHQQSW